MDHFLYRDGALYAEDVPISEIAAAVGTPFYVYSTATLLRHFQLFDDALEGSLGRVVMQRQAAMSDPPARFDGHRLSDQQARPRHRQSAVMDEVPVGRFAVDRAVLAHRAHDDAIVERQAAQVDGREKG